jgi:transketolase
MLQTEGLKNTSVAQLNDALIKNLTLQATKIRLDIVEMVKTAQCSHVGSCFSVVDILTVLYHNFLDCEKIKNIKKDRDILILSKGHSAMALYATLSSTGIINKKILKTYFHDGSQLLGHPVKGSLPGIEASTGSLGHGLPLAVGLAIAAKNNLMKNRIYVLMGDGECQEGSVWESLNIAARLNLNNLAIIVDQNDLQGFDRSSNLMPGSIEDRFKSFCFNTRQIDGHDFSQIIDAIESCGKTNSPDAIVAKTIKGKGVSFTQDKLEWHYRSFNQEQYEFAKNELGALCETLS